MADVEEDEAASGADEKLDGATAAASRVSALTSLLRSRCGRTFGLNKQSVFLQCTQSLNGGNCGDLSFKRCNQRQV